MGRKRKKPIDSERLSRMVGIRISENDYKILMERAKSKSSDPEKVNFSKYLFRCICRIKADDVMMTFDLGRFLILVKPGICDLTFFIERQRIAIQSVHVEFFTENAPVKFIQDLFPVFSSC